LTLAVLFGSGRPVLAEPTPADPAQLAKLLRAGAEAATAKRWSACVDALTAALALDAAAKTRGDLGLCEEQAGRFALAFTHLNRAMESAPPQPTKDPWKRYQAALARVMERVVQLTVSASPPNAKIVLDGRPLGAADGRLFAVDPGVHTIGARLDGYVDQVETRDWRAGDAPSFHFQLMPKPPEPPPVSSSVSSAKLVTGPTTTTKGAASLAPSLLGAPWYQPAWTPRGALVGLTWVSAGTALVSGLVAVGLELDRQSLQRGLSDGACFPSSSMPAQCSTLHERAIQRNAAEGVFIGALVGALAFGGATVAANLLDRAPARATIAVRVDRSGGGFAVGGAW
jgi:hypothetical protein